MSKEPRPDLNSPESPHFFTDGDDHEAAAWTEVEAGRFMPRRVRGSNRGRALG
ncbi:MAG: hypothetical protein KY475_06480 [Planctomycetes bacterium]|nr:hypothetical protein [Planctomycetota bacterium]